jgi:hypothetical protein
MLLKIIAEHLFTKGEGGEVIFTTGFKAKANR